MGLCWLSSFTNEVGVAFESFLSLIVIDLNNLQILLDIMA